MIMFRFCYPFSHWLFQLSYPTPGLNGFWDQSQANSALYSAFWSVEQTNFNDYIFEISLFHWSECTIEYAIRLTLISKSAQARCDPFYICLHSMTQLPGFCFVSVSFLYTLSRNLKMAGICLAILSLSLFSLYEVWIDAFKAFTL